MAMSSLYITSASSTSFSSKRSLVVNAAPIHVPFPKSTNIISVPKVLLKGLLTTLFITNSSSLQLLEKNNINVLTTTTTNLQDHSSNSQTTMQLLYAILASVADRIEMHKNLCEQRQNWNNLLLNNINIITLTASTMAAVAAATATAGSSATPLLALKLSSALLFSAATGMLLIMNKIQPSQLAEEQRNATRLFKQLHTKIETIITLGNYTEEDVKCSVENVLALDKAYPLPLLGAMLEKFPSKYEPANWWPTQRKKSSTDKKMENRNNGWSKELESEMREVIEVVKNKDIKDYERLGNIALKVNKNLAIAGPLLTGIAAAGSVLFIGDSNPSLASMVPVVAGSLAAAVNAFEHGGQVGMVFEMYRNCGGFFKLLEETTNATLEDKDFERRENGEVFEMKMALKLGRSVSELRELALKSAYCRTELGIDVDELANKLF